MSEPKETITAKEDAADAPADPYLRLSILNRGLTTVPLYNNHKRARNWCATVDADPNAPGGLTRHFWATGRGKMFYYIIPETLDRTDVIEFGADGVSYSGRRTPDRLYAVVAACSSTELVLAVCATAADAFAGAAKWRALIAAKRAAGGTP